MNKTINLNDRFSFELDNECFVYSPLDKKLLKVSSECFNELKEVCTEDHWKKTLDPESNLGLFLGQPPNNNEYVSTYNYDGLVLLLTNSCNMRCKYCYAKNAQNNPSFMKEKTWKTVLHEFFAKCDTDATELSLAFHGYGECSLYPQEIMNISREFHSNCASLGKNAKFQITTNGTFNEKLCEFIIENDFFINLSLDGDKAVNDLNRITKKGIGSYDKAAKNIAKITMSGKKDRLMIRATVTNETVAEMSNSFKHFHYLGANLAHIEPVYIRGAAGSIEHDPVYLFEEYERQYKKCALYGNENGMKIYYGPINFGIGVRFCSHEKKLMVDHEGRVVSCVEAGSGAGLDEFKYGQINITNGAFQTEISKVQELNSRNCKWYKECADCLLKFHCAGNCPASRIGGSWDSTTQELTCKHNDSIFKWILARIAKGENVSSVVDFPLHRVW